MKLSICLRSMLVIGAALSLLATAASCRKSDPPEKKAKASEKKSSKSKTKKPSAADVPQEGVDKRVEEFTGAHTRIVWAELPEPGASDTFTYTNDLLLKGLDSRDGKGEREILSAPSNYSRPLLSTDGSTIVFTDKNLVRRSGLKHYEPVIYRTDWQGTAPVRLAEGYAADCWRDPATGVEWVYAVREFKASTALAMEAARMIRFRLDDPTKEEVVYEDSPVTPDNIQFSRDGAQASGLFPWPDVCIFERAPDGVLRPRKLMTGCWPSLAPDNSGVAWVFDGSHRLATFFAQDGREPWTVHFNTGPGMENHEVYHPRWSNHPRYLALSGPYVPVKNSSESVVNKGGGTAQIYIGRFSAGLDKVEAWLQVTHDRLSESYPDLWIEGGDKVDLAMTRGAAAPVNAASAGGTWPVVKSGLIYAWGDRNAANEIAGADGKMHRAPAPVGHDAARFGGLEEMVVGGGFFEMGTDAAGALIKGMQSAPEMTVEMMLVPGAGGTGTGMDAIFSGPNLTIGAGAGGALIVAQTGMCVRSAGPMPQAPFHLVVVRKQGAVEIYVNGEASALQPHEPVPPAPAADRVVFGGGWDGGMLHVGIFNRALAAGEAMQEATAALAALSKKPPAPPRVTVAARLVETSAMPSAEGIAPYTGSLVAYVYEIEKVISGELPAGRFVVKHWAMLDQKTVEGFPREMGKTYELVLESEAGHRHLKGERVMDDTTAFDLETWFDVSPPKVRQQP
jgi:hypothetical protein